MSPVNLEGGDVLVDRDELPEYRAFNAQSKTSPRGMWEPMSPRYLKGC